MRWGWLVAMWAIVFAIAGIYVLFSRVNLSANQQPGRTGEYLRTRITRAVVRRRAAREDIPAPPADRETSMSILAGNTLYATDCAGCHGPDGRESTAIGRGMLPRTVALDSSVLQSYSDRELFSIIRDGIRFTGMPGFSATENEDQIWDVVDYLRSLP